MRKFVVLFILSLGIFVGVLWKVSVQKPRFVQPKSIQQQESEITAVKHAVLFVPYWEASAPVRLPQTSYADTPVTLIYFGIAPNKSGIDTEEAGYGGIASFLENTSTFTGEKLLTLRLTNDTITRVILADQRLQNTLLNQAVSTVTENGFDGLVIDLELGGFGTEKTINQISVFARIARAKLHAQQLSLGMTIYGDVLYRARPYDLRDLGTQVDMLYIMAYDLHKTLGTPGPNFPLSGNDRFGYDLQTMVADVSALVSRKKLTIVFGMYGYDWWVDEKKRPIARAKPLTLSEIRAQFLGSCELQNCVVRRDSEATETEVNYVDEAGGLHIVWFEDEESLEQKVKFLQTKGVGAYGIWAAGYY